jgi:transposase
MTNVYVCEGKDASTIGSFKDDLEDHNGSCINVRNFCCDMSPAFISGVARNFPKTSITFDKFHVMKLMNQALDQVRREEQFLNSILKRTRYIWLKNPEKLTKKKRSELGSLRDMRLKTMRAYNIKLSLRGFSEALDPHMNRRRFTEEWWA